MKFKDYFAPKLPKHIFIRNLVSTYIVKRQTPNIEMSMPGEPTENKEITATVKFNYLLPKSKINKEQKIYTRIITGPSNSVYKTSIRAASRIGLNLEREFNSLWQRTLMQLLNAPSQNKSILNLGVYRKDGYGIYDIAEPSTLLTRKLNASGMKQKDLALLAGVDETTLYRHLKGTFEISRDSAIKYAKA